MDGVTVGTRRESYQRIADKMPDRRNLVLAILDDREMTASEIAQELCDRGFTKYYDRNFVAPRLTELKAAGKVEAIGKRTCLRSGRNIAVWKRCEE